MCYTGVNKMLILSVPDGNANAEMPRKSHDLLEAEGVEVIDVPHISGFMARENYIVTPYMNFYTCNGAAIMPLAMEDPDSDDAAKSALQVHFPDSRIIAVKMRVVIDAGHRDPLPETQ